MDDETETIKDAERWREFVKRASFELRGFNTIGNESWNVLVELPTEWDDSFIQAIDRAIEQNK